MTTRTPKAKVVKPKRKTHPASVPERRPQLAMPNVALVQTLLDRVRVLADVWSRYTAYFAVMTIIGIFALQVARTETIPWIAGLVVIAECLALMEMYIKSKSL
jgi:hypothetical protein